jgi:UDP-glucose 4-epimerase
VVAKYMGTEKNIEFLPARNEVVNAYSNHAKVRKVFGIQNETPLDEGVMKMVEWSKKIGAMDSKKFKNIELTKNMPQSWQKLI